MRPVGIRFKEAGKVFYYDAGDSEVPVSTYVVVETSHGPSLGRVVIAPDQVIASEFRDELKPILRLASEEDVEKAKELKERAEKDAAIARKKVAEHGLPITIASGEWDLDGSQFTAFFTSTERIDFRALVRDLSRDLDARVQLLQVGDRDRAKLVDGIDICGQRLCCASWMTNFPSVSIRMAKEQDLPLNPQKISGVCGRLYCCLTFEYEDYKALRGTLPKVGSFLSTPAGEAKVASIDFIRERVKLFLMESRSFIEIAATDLKLQHGVTVRPMELVHKIEGELRPITEDGAAGRQQQRPRRAPARQVPPPRDGQRRDGRGPRPAGPPPPPPPPSPPPQAQASQAPGGEGASKRRRRRRRRGRGPGAPPEAGSDSA